MRRNSACGRWVGRGRNTSEFRKLTNMSTCTVPVVYPDLDDTQRFVPEPKPEPAPGPTCWPPPRRRMSAIQLEVRRRLNDPAWGVRETKQAKPRRERVKPVSIMEAEAVPEPKSVEAIQKRVAIKAAAPAITEPIAWERKVEEFEPFVWDRAKTLALAAKHCVHCMGLGLKRSGRRDNMQTCGCVLRKAFNSVLGKYRYIQAHRERAPSWIPIIIKHGREQKRVWSMKNEEFCADFYLVSKRSLQEQEWKIFELHILAGNDWRYCTRILGMDRGNFFHSVYRIKQKLGRIFMELRPYALFPIDEYFAGVRSEKTRVCEQRQVSGGFSAPIRQVGAFA